MSFAPQTSNFESKAQKLSQVNVKLLERLATGKKQTVDKKEMRKLTQKNFQNLPEIKQRLEDEKR